MKIAHFRGRFKFGIRTLLVIVVAIAFPLSWIALERHQSRFELQVVKRLGVHDDRIECGALNECWEYYGREPDDWWHRLLINVLGKRILACELNGQTIGDDDLSLLAEFSNLQVIWATDCKLGDLSRLKSLRRLKMLVLTGSSIREVGSLAAFGQLQYVMLYDLTGKQEEIDALQKALPNCKIDYAFAR